MLRGSSRLQRRQRARLRKLPVESHGSRFLQRYTRAQQTGFKIHAPHAAVAWNQRSIYFHQSERLLVGAALKIDAAGVDHDLSRTPRGAGSARGCVAGRCA